MQMPAEDCHSLKIYSLLRAVCALLGDFVVMVTCLVHACVRMTHLLTISEQQLHVHLLIMTRKV